MLINSNKKFHYFSKGDCPVCLGQRKDCRQSDDLIFCLGDNPSPDYRFTGEDRNGFGMFVHGFTDAIQQADWKAKREAQKQQRQLKAERERAGRLSHTDLNFHLIRLQKFLTLSPQHREDLKRRGLSDAEIDAGGFRSILKGQKVPGMDWRVPGFNRGGIWVSRSGMLCPATDADGRIIGNQIKADDPSESGKYPWAKGVNPSNLRSGELPITVARPLNSPQKDFIGLIEGILKPQIAASRHQVVFLGAAGGNFASSPQEFKRNLDQVSAELGTRLVVLFADAGSKLNRNVLSRYAETIELVESWGYQVQIAWWLLQEIKKSEGGKDCDEIPAGTPYQLLSWKDWLPGGVPKNQRLKIKQEEWAEQRAKTAHQAWLDSRKLTPTEEINERYFPEENIQWEKNYQAIKSGLGTGKSEAIARALSRLEGGAVALGSRNGLLLQLCERWDFYHLREHDPREQFKDPNLRIAFCVDSLLHLDRSFFQGKTLIIDEIESVIEHLLRGETCRKQRTQLKRLFTEACQAASQIVVLDGNLTNKTLKYLSRVTDIPRHQWEVYQNNFHVEKPLVEFHLGTVAEGKLKTTNTKVLHQFILNAKLPIILSDSQNECQAIEEALIQTGREGIRVDSRTVDDPVIGKTIRQFLQNPDEWIAENKPQYVIISPTAESGLDISIPDYFSDCYLISFGVLGVSSLLQMLGRCRHPQAIHCFIREFGRGDNLTRSPLPDEIRAVITANALEEAKTLLGNDGLVKELVKASQDCHFDHTLELIARENYEKANLRQCFLEALRESGYAVQITVTDTDETAGITQLPPGTKIGVGSETDLVKELKQDIKERNAETIANSRNLTETEANQLEAKFCISWLEQAALIKYHLTCQLPGVELTPELVYDLRYRNRRLLWQLYLLWELLKPEGSEILARHQWHKRAEAGEFSLTDTRHHHLTASKLIHIGLSELLTLPAGSVISERSEIVQKIYKNSKRRGIKEAIGSTPGNLNPIQWVSRLLAMVGRKLKLVTKKRTKNGREREYQVVPESQFEGVILESYFSKNNSEVERVQSLTQQGLEAGTVETDSYYKELNQVSQNSELISPSDSDPIPSAIATPPPPPELPPTPVELDPIDELTHKLGTCENSDQLALLRETHPATDLQAASLRLAMDKKQQIKEWVIELNRPPLPPPAGAKPLRTLGEIFLNCWNETFTEFREHIALWTAGRVVQAKIENLRGAHEVILGGGGILSPLDLDRGDWYLVT